MDLGPDKKILKKNNKKTHCFSLLEKFSIVSMEKCYQNYGSFIGGSLESP